MEEVKKIFPEELEKMLNDLPGGSLKILDVRQPFEYEEQHIPGAELIPLPDLPERLHELDRNVPWVVYCRTGRRSEMASKILMSEGFSDVSNLIGGITEWVHGTAKGSPDSGIVVFDDVQNVPDLLAVSYGMERELQKFYSRFEKLAKDSELKEALNKLASFEESHMKVLSHKYEELTDENLTNSMVEEIFKHQLLEGGLDEEFISGEIEKFQSDIYNLFELALSFEAQAYDLYMRASRNVKDEEVASMCLTLAQSEGYHMKIVGRLMDAHVESNSQ